MQGMIGMSKKDLIEFINENFSEYHENDTIATFFIAATAIINRSSSAFYSTKKSKM